MTTDERMTCANSDTQADQMPFWQAVMQSSDMTPAEKLPHLAQTCRWYGDILNYVEVALERGDINAATACLRNPYACLGEYAPTTDDDCTTKGETR